MIGTADGNTNRPGCFGPLPAICTRGTLGRGRKARWIRSVTFVFSPRLSPVSQLLDWRPGWIGNVVAGAIAAPVIWGIYGPLAGRSITAPEPIELTLIQAFTSIVIGFGGGRILTLEAQKQAERVAKNNVTELVEKSIV